MIFSSHRLLAGHKCTHTVPYYTKTHNYTDTVANTATHSCRKTNRDGARQSLTIRNVTKIGCGFSSTDLEQLIHTFSLTHLDYCNSLYTCLSQAALNRLLLVQNAAARLLTGSSPRPHITPVLVSLHCLPVKFRIHHKILSITAPS